MSQKVVSFGEIMLRLGSPGFERLFQSATLTATFGGGEANVAVSLAQFGLRSDYVTRVPVRSLGQTGPERVQVSGPFRLNDVLIVCRPIRSGTPSSALCAPKAWTPRISLAAAVGSASISRRPAPASAPRP